VKLTLKLSNNCNIYFVFILKDLNFDGKFKFRQKRIGLSSEIISFDIPRSLKEEAQDL